MIGQSVRFVSRMTFAAALLLLTAGPARATVCGLSQLAQEHGDILYQWTFETGDDGGFKDARSGGVNLTDTYVGTSSRATSGAGFDVSSDAMRSMQVTPEFRTNGAALRTNGSLSMPASGTIEYLFKTVTAECDNATYIVAASVASGNRRYYGVDRTGPGYKHVDTAFGSTFSQIVPGSGVTYTEDRWYYAAVTYEPNGASNTLINSYVADLTTGDVAATRTIANLNTDAVPGAITIPTLGLGCLGASTGSSGVSFYDGSVDQVSIYSTALSASEINDHVATIQQTPDLRVDIDYRNYPSGDDQWVGDASSWNNDAVLGNSSSTSDRDPGLGQRGFIFDPSGAGNQLTIQRNSSLKVANIDADNDFTLEMWLSPEQFSETSSQAIVDARQDTPTNGWGVWVAKDGSVKLKLYQDGVGEWEMLSDAGLLQADGIYQHMVIALDADGAGNGLATFYVDGEQWGATKNFTGATSYIDPDAPIRIGHQRDFTTGLTPFDGEIGVFRLYAKALNENEVLSSFRSDATFFTIIPEPSAIIVWLGGLLFVLVRNTRRRRR